MKATAAILALGFILAAATSALADCNAALSKMRDAKAYAKLRQWTAMEKKQNEALFLVERENLNEACQHKIAAIVAEITKILENRRKELTGN